MTGERNCFSFDSFEKFPKQSIQMVEAPPFAGQLAALPGHNGPGLFQLQITMRRRPSSEVLFRGGTQAETALENRRAAPLKHWKHSSHLLSFCFCVSSILKLGSPLHFPCFRTFAPKTNTGRKNTSMERGLQSSLNAPLPIQFSVDYTDNKW